MLTKTIKPIIRKTSMLKGEDTFYTGIVIGTLVEYRLLGILLYKKQLFTPSYYGVKSWEDYQFRI